MKDVDHHRKEGAIAIVCYFRSIIYVFIFCTMDLCD